MAALAVVCLARSAYPIEPNRMFSQYPRDHWGVEQGFTGGSVTSFAQTPDGYLWIGTEKGLIRFDGLTFRLFQQASPTTFPIGAVQGLMTDAQGNLWILLQGTRILRYHDGQFELAREEAEFGITSIARRGDGTVLFSSLTLGVLTYRAGRFEILTSPDGRAPSERTATTETDDRSTRLSWATQLARHRLAEPNSVVISMAEDADGKVWLGTRNKGLFYMKEGRVFAARKGQLNTTINCLLPLENGELWVGTENGVVRWDGSKLTQLGVPALVRRGKIHALLRGRDAKIWAGTAKGLIRANEDRASYDADNPGDTGAVTALFEDREGNLWVGRSGRIERLRNSLFLTYSVGDSGSGPIYVDEEGRAWFAPLEGSLHWLKGTETGAIKDNSLSKDVVYSIAGRKHELWIGRRRRGLTRLDYDSKAITTRTYTETDGLAQNSVYAVYESHDGTVWSGTLSSGVSKLKDGHFKNYSTIDGLASNTVSSIAEGPDGSMWFGTAKGLSEFSKNRWRNYADRDGLVSPEINCLLQDSRGVLWIGTARGLAFLRNGRVQNPQGTQPWLSDPIFGMAEDDKEGLWIATSNLVLRAKRNSLTSGQTLNDSDFRVYGRDDGLRGTEGVKRFRSVVKDSQGNVWFSTNRGLSIVNVERSTVNSLPALLHIEAVTMDGSEVNLGQPIRVPPGEHRIIFHYVGLSLANPELVRYRYRLDGVDREWSQAVSTREATFSNLSPGTYRFRVLGSNSDGIWNTEEASLEFAVLPAYYQTVWFRTLCAAAFLGSLWMLYRLRVRQLQQKFAMVIDARVNERTRIARELHDTVLQGLHGLLICFQRAANLLPERPIEAKQRLEGAIEQAAQAITEGRDAVQGLRSSTVITNDLAAAIQTLGEELAAKESNQDSPTFNVAVEGTSRDLKPILRDDVYRIAGEALRNAFRHAEARHVEVEIQYDDLHLRLRVRDDGRGVDPRLLNNQGRPGHWGLQGMRERAKLVGGHLEIWSEVDSGTEIELSIPASIAYCSAAPRQSKKRTAIKL